MKMQVPFMQLPLVFDAAALQAEIGAIAESAWRPHPQGYPGNDALTLITVGGDPDSDAADGSPRALRLSAAGARQHRRDLGADAPDEACRQRRSDAARRRQLLLAR